MAALFLLLTAIMAYPVSLRPESGIIGDSPDGHLFLWTLAWNTFAFAHQPFAIFDANIFHPLDNALAYSENLIGSALFAAPIIWGTGNPLIALNLVSLLSCALCGLGAYVLGRKLGLSQEGAIFTGLVFAFAPARFFRMPQMHVNAVQWIPFSLAFLHAYLANGRSRDLRLAAGFFSLQALASGHGATFLMVAIVGLLAYQLVLGEPVAPLRRLRDLGVSGVLLLAPSVLIYLPYRRAQVEMNLVRSLEPEWGATLESFFASPSLFHTWLLAFVRNPHVNETATAFLFPGYVPLAMAGVALWRAGKTRSSLTSRIQPRPAVWTRVARLVEIAGIIALGMALVVSVYGPIRLRVGTLLLFTARGADRAWIMTGVLACLRVAMVRYAPLAWPSWLRAAGPAGREWWRGQRRRTRTYRVFYALLVILCVLLSLGPPFGIWPLVYWLPGLNFIRASSRFMVLGILGIAVLAGIGLDRLTVGATGARRARLAAGIASLLLLESAGPIQFDPYRWQIPEVDRWFASRSTPAVIAELPVWNFERYQTIYMLHSTAHWQKTIHGYSGLRPPSHELLYRQLQHFPDEVSLRALVDFGVDHVVIHTDFYPPEQWPVIRERLKDFSPWLTLEYQNGPGRIYSLRDPGRGRR